MPLSTPYFSSFTGGQTIIPVGTRAFSIDIISGLGYVNGVMYPAGKQLSWVAPDEKILLGGTIAVGTTGAVNKINVFYST